MPKLKRSHITAEKKNWKKFKKEYPEHKDLPYKTFREILYKEGEMITNYLLETGEKLQLSHGLGDMRIARRKMRKFRNKETGEMQPSHSSINWPATKEVGHYVFYKNYNTNGYYCTWAWFPKSSKIKFSKMWSCEFAKVHTQKLSNLLLSKDNQIHLLYKEST